jgi:Fe-S oxidoreductase
MCPSSKITRDRRHSPKGRAGLIREWLLQLHKHGVNEHALSYQQFSSNVFARLFASGRTKDDFSHEVFEAMNGCLACKSCSNQCPVNVDVPDFRSKFLAIYYTRYQRPVKDYFVANVERLAPVLAKLPRLANALLDLSAVKYILREWVGYVDAPQLSFPPLNERVSALSSQYDYERLANLDASEKAQYVLIVQDPFTSFYDAESVDSTLKFIHDLGLKPVLLPFSPNGKPQHVKGFLQAFEKTARSTSAFLNKIAQLEIPMLGIDASLVLCYRDEYTKLLGQDRGDFSVLSLTEWLMSLPSERYRMVEADTPEVYHLFAHCSEKTALPTTEVDWQMIFSKFGLSLEVIPVGCCGMAGTYGHETEHLDNSIGIYNLSWRAKVASFRSESVLATGYSCRSQVKRLADFRPQHPIEVLASVLKR